MTRNALTVTSALAIILAGMTFNLSAQSVAEWQHNSAAMMQQQTQPVSAPANPGARAKLTRMMLAGARIAFQTATVPQDRDVLLVSTSNGLRAVFGQNDSMYADTLVTFALLKNSNLGHLSVATANNGSATTVVGSQGNDLLMFKSNNSLFASQISRFHLYGWPDALTAGAQSALACLFYGGEPSALLFTDAAISSFSVPLTVPAGMQGCVSAVRNSRGDLFTLDIASGGTIWVSRSRLTGAGEWQVFAQDHLAVAIAMDASDNLVILTAPTPPPPQNNTPPSALSDSATQALRQGSIMVTNSFAAIPQFGIVYAGPRINIPYGPNTIRSRGGRYYFTNYTVTADGTYGSPYIALSNGSEPEMFLDPDLLPVYSFDLLN